MTSIRLSGDLRGSSHITARPKRVLH